MDSQVLEEPYDQQDLNEYFLLDTSQSSQNTVLNPIADVNFSSITDVADFPLFDIPDFSEFEQAEPSLYDPEDKFHEIPEDGDESIFGDMPCDEQFTYLTKQLDVMELEAIDLSIQNREMKIKIQPPTDIRRRYETDGKRQIEKSRSKPMAIKLPNLKNCTKKPELSFWLQLYLITTDQNPSNTVYVHSDKLEYHVNDVLQSDYGSVRIPITPDEIEEEVKQLARISIIKKKLDSYTFELIPFASLSTNPTETIYENKRAKTVVAKAKCFRDEYHLTSSRIACQLLIKQNDTWHTTDIVCQTNIMEEKKQTNEQKGKKRSADEVDDDDYIPQLSRRKEVKGLPVIRV